MSHWGRGGRTGVRSNARRGPNPWPSGVVSLVVSLLLVASSIAAGVSVEAVHAAGSDDAGFTVLEVTNKKGQSNERIVTANWTFAANASVEKLVVHFVDSSNATVPTTDSNPKTISSPANSGSVTITFRPNDENSIAEARVTQVLSNGSIYECAGAYGNSMTLASFTCGITDGGEALNLTTSGGTTSFVEGGGPVTVDGSIVVNGSSFDSFRGGRVSIDEGFDPGADVLDYDSSVVPVDSSGTPIIDGTYNASTGVLAFNGTASVAAYQDLLRTVTFDSGESPPATADRNVTFTLVAADKTDREVFYNPATGHYYEYVESTDVTWDAAKTGAAGRSYDGLSGYLTTVTSAAENEFLYDRFRAGGWLGGSDAASEGTWRWVTGPEGAEESGAGREFFNQTAAHVAFTDPYPDPPAGVPGGGSGVNGEYSNWAPRHEPDNKFPFFGGQDGAYLCAGPGRCPDGMWKDAAADSPPFTAEGYFVEYGGQGGTLEAETVNLTAWKVVTVTTSVSDSTAPTASATANETTVAIGETVQLDGSGSDGTGSTIARYEWDTSGNGRTDLTGATNTTSFERAGNYTVTLTVTDGGGNTDTDTVTISVADTNPPTAVISVNGSTTVERGATIEFTGSNSTDDVAIQSFEWRFGDGTANSSEVSPTHGYDATGTYTVDLTVTDTSGNTDTASQAITVTTSPRPKIYDFNLTNPSGSSLNASLTTDQQLTDVVVEVYDSDALTPRDNDSGALLYTIEFGHVTETTASGNYTYTNTTTGLADGNYTARLVTASNANGDSGTEQEDTATIANDASSPAFLAGYPTTRNPTTNTFDVAVKANESGTAYWVVVADGASAPSTAQIVAGQNASGSAAIASGSGDIAANAERAFTASGLTSGTPFDAYVVVEDDGGNTNTSGGLDESTTDDTAPVLANATLTDATDGNGIVASGDSVTIRVDATDADGVANVTANASALGAGSAVALADGDGDGTWNATITVGSAGTPIEDTQTVDLAANDTLGNENTTTTGSLEVDTTAPTVASVTTLDRDGDGSVDAATVVFSEAVNDSSIAAAEWTIGGVSAESWTTSAGGDADADDDTIQVRITTDSNEVAGTDAKNVTYTAGATADHAGNALAAVADGDVAETDGAAPTITGLEIDDTGADGLVDEVVLTFSEAVDTDDGAAPVAADVGSALTLPDGSTASFENATLSDPAGTASTLTITGIEGQSTANTAAGSAGVAGDLSANWADGAGNAILATLDDESVTDSAAPVIVSVKTDDADANGKVDRLRVNFSEAVASGSVEAADFSVGSANGLAGTLGGDSSDDGDDTVVFAVSEGGSADTNATPTLVYASAGGSIDAVQDGAGNLLADATTVSATDGAAPVLLTAVETATGPSTLTATFSEPVWTGTGQSGSLVAGDFSYTDADGSVSVSSVSHSAGNVTATMTLSGDAAPGSDTLAAASNAIYDGADAAAATTAVTVTDSAGPSITSMTVPANGTHANGDTLTFTVTYDEAVVVTGTPSIDLDVGGTVRRANFSDGNATTTLTFEYAVQSGDVDADGIAFDDETIQLNGGTMADASGNDADRNFSAVAPSLAKVNADGTRPQDPDSTGGATINASNVGGYAVDVTFSSAPEAGTVTVELDDGSANVTASTAANTSGTTTTITGIDASSLAEGTVNLTAKIVDSAGNENPAGHTAESTATKDTVAPGITNFSVADGPGTTLNVSFDSNESLSTVSVAITGDTTTNLTSFQQSGSTYYATYDVGTNGTFTATLENATDAAGNDAATASDSLTTVDPATIDAVAVASTYGTGVGSDVRFDASDSTVPEGETATYDWAFGDGATGSAETVHHSYSTPGTYTVNLTMTVGTATANDTLTITVEDLRPPVGDAGPDRSVANGSTVAFDGSGSTDDVGVTGYAWRFGDGATATGQSPSHAYDSPGTYEVNLTVTDDADHSHTDFATVTVLGPETSAGTTAIAFGDVAVGSTNVSSVSITNTGTVPLNVTNATFAGADPGAFALAGSVASNLPVIQPGVTESIAVAFSPSSVGSKAATLTVETNHTDVDLSLTGTGVASDLEFDASTVDFGDVDVGASARRSVVVENNGSATATIDAVSIVGDASGGYSVVDDGGLPGDLAPGGNRTLTVEFAPDAAGEQTAALRIETDDGTRVAVGLTGSGQGPNVSLSSGPIDFGEVGKGNESTETVRIANHGTTTLTVSGVTVVGTNASAFSTSDVPTSVAAGSTETLNVTFAPTEAGNYSARLEVSTDDPDTPTATVDLEGTGVAPDIGVDQKNLDFGNVSVGNTSTLNVTVRNLATSKANLSVDSLVMTGRDPSHFEVVNVAAPFTLAPGQTQRLEVEFTPQSEGVKQAQLRILSDAANRPQIDVWLSNTRTYVVVQEVGVDVRTDPKVDIDAHNLDTDGVLSVNVSQRSTNRRSVGFDELTMTVAPGGDFSMNLTYSDGSLSQTYDVDGVEALQFVDLAHALPNSDFDDTSIRFRVKRSTLPSGTDADEIRFRRYNTSAGEWRAHAATLESQSATHYVYSVDTPGFSAFVVTAPSASSGGGGGPGPDDDDPEPTPAPTGPTDDDPPEEPPEESSGPADAIGAISVDGTSGETPSVSVDPQALIFEDVPVGSTVTRTLVLENRVTSETTFAVDSLAIVGQHPENFEVVGGDAPVALAPGETHRVRIAYTATVVGERNAQLAIRSNAAREQIDVWLSNTPGYVVVQSVAVDSASPGTSPDVAIDGYDIERGRTLAIAVSRERTRAKASSVETIGMAVLTGGDFEMLLAHATEPFGDAPALETDPGFRVLQYVRLDHSMSNAELEDTAFEYRVRKDALPAGADPGSITFYRYADGAWNAHESELVSETASAYRYRVATPGFSTFAVTGPAAVTAADCSLFGVDYGHYLVCWYWWALLIVLLVLLAVGYRRYRRHRDDRRRTLLDQPGERRNPPT